MIQSPLTTDNTLLLVTTLPALHTIHSASLDVEARGLGAAVGEESLLRTLHLQGAGGRPAEPRQPGLQPAQPRLQHCGDL